MSNPTSNFGWQMPTATDLVTDLPADFEVFGQAVDTDLADLNGGTTGQVLSKTSGTDLDFTWVDPTAGDITGVTAGTGISGGGTSGTVTVTNSMATAIDAKGDLIAGTADDTFSALAVGANDTVLTADSSTATGLKWAAAAGGAGNMAQIATGTLSGASVQITGLTSYTDILVLFYDATNDTSNGGFRARLNSTASNHRDFGFRYTTSFGRINNGPTDYFAISNDSVLYTDNANVSAFKLTNCKNAGFTDIDIYSIYVRSGGGNGITVTKGIYTLSETVSTIDIVNTGGNWNAGTYYVWGA